MLKEKGAERNTCIVIHLTSVICKLLSNYVHKMGLALGRSMKSGVHSDISAFLFQDTQNITMISKPPAILEKANNDNHFICLSTDEDL